MNKEDLNYKITHHLFLIKNIINSGTKKNLDVDYLINYKDENLGLKARDLLFELEGLLRLHLKTKSFNKKDSERANTILEFLKRTEDTLGRLDMNEEIKKESKNDSIISDKEKTRILKYLRNDWRNIETVEHHFKSLALKYNSKDIKNMLKKELKRINKKSKTLKPIICANKKYTYKTLESGFHEWRRAIRWISIYVQFYKPLFTLKEDPKNKTPFPLKKEFENSQFTSFSKKAPISLTTKSFYELSAYIFYSGKIKEKLERDILLKKHSFINYQYSCQQMYNNFHKQKVLIKLRKGLQ